MSAVVAGRAFLPVSAKDLVGGTWCALERTAEIRDPYRGDVVGTAPLSSAAEVAVAVEAAVGARAKAAAMPPYERAALLRRAVALIDRDVEDLAELLTRETGKAIRDSRAELQRSLETVQLAAEEAIRIEGRHVPLDGNPMGAGKLAMLLRFPVGVVAAITPFNAPFNLAAHKIAPALAVGCPFVLKPASLTPVGALLIGEVLAETALPPGAFSILPARREGAALFTSDERLKLLSFTGSPDVGWGLKARAGKKKVVLELGGNAAVIIDADWDLDDAVARVVYGAFYQSGQSCISVQRILAHADIYDAFRAKLVAASQSLKLGDPLDEATFLGPMISEDEAQRVESWIQAALRRGARLLCGGKRRGAMLEATLLEDVPPDSDLCAKEVFGPVAVLARFRDFDAALREANASSFGLQAGVFTRDLYKAKRAWDELEVGGVVIGDVPSWRVDHMPYGGVKDSGFGREGVRFAMEEMTEIRLLVARTP